LDNGLKKLLLTGASGFVGRHLIRALAGREFQVFALDSEPPRADWPASVVPIRADLGDLPSLRVLSGVDWWGVIHLAGISVPGAFTSPGPLLTNLGITLNLLEALDQGRVLLVSSCHVYAPSREPHREDQPVRPQGLYGLSKHLVEQAASHYQSKLDVRIARPFNHIGTDMRPELMIPSLLRRLRGEAAGEDRPVRMLGQNSVRDFIDVRDVVQAYLAILDLEAPVDKIFNVCTGQGHSIEDLVRTALGLLGSSRPVQFENQQNSPDDIPCLVGDPARLTRACNWTAKYRLKESLEILLGLGQA
jgi:GDP-4-dehydro-6-deoxy-D-mannose reductase